MATTQMLKGISQVIAVCMFGFIQQASAAFFQWESVELPAVSGAACGDGSPYRFFVNRNPFTQKTVIMFEGGGGCWDQAACEGKVSLGATNPNGIPSNYLTQLNQAAFGLVTPFTARLHPLQQVRTQGWNIVYMPYCTGDVHTGSVVRVYDDANPTTPRVQYHKGLFNSRVASKWIRDHIGRPSQLLVTGFSAGGVGATAEYVVVRDTLSPTGPSSLLADSGPLFHAPQSGTPEQYPSLPLQNKIRSAWGADLPNGIVAAYQSALPDFDRTDLGSVYGALAKRFKSDRFGYMLFKSDGVFPAFSYKGFDPAISNATDQATALSLMNQHWLKDIDQWLPDLAKYANISYHVPYMRDFGKSHCLTVIDWSGTGIKDSGVDNIASFVDNLLDGGPAMRNVQQDNTPGETSPALKLFTYVMSIFG